MIQMYYILYLVFTIFLLTSPFGVGRVTLTDAPIPKAAAPCGRTTQALNSSAFQASDPTLDQLSGLPLSFRATPSNHLES